MYFVNYIGGHPQISPGSEIKLWFENNSLFLKKYPGKKHPDIIIAKDDIINVSLDQQSKRSAGKAAAGALIGGALTGGVGLIAGAALGGRRKNISNIIITYKYNNRVFDLIINTKKKTDIIYNELITFLSK